MMHLVLYIYCQCYYIYTNANVVITPYGSLLILCSFLFLWFGYCFICQDFIDWCEIWHEALPISQAGLFGAIFLGTVKLWP